jgi:hypothetical protein
MTQADWQNLLKIGIIRRYKTGSVIIQEGSKPDGVFQIIRGTCDVKINKQTAVNRATSKDEQQSPPLSSKLSPRKDEKPEKDKVSFIFPSQLLLSLARLDYG